MNALLQGSRFWPHSGRIFITTTIVGLFLMGISCQSTKNAQKGPDLVGKDVQMTELRQAIQSQITDPTRSNTLLGMTAQAENELGASNDSFIEHSKKFGKLSADHSKSANDLRVYLRGWDSEAHTQRQRLANLLLAMRAQTTAAEWPAISNAYLNSIMAQSDRYQTLRSMSY